MKRKKPYFLPSSRLRGQTAAVLYDVQADVLAIASENC